MDPYSPLQGEGSASYKGGGEVRTCGNKTLGFTKDQIRDDFRV